MTSIPFNSLRCERTGEPGDLYLVDVGKLVPVLASNPIDAFVLASFEGTSEHPILYRLDDKGNVLEILA